MPSRLLDEALRREAHLVITSRDGPSGRRAGLVGGPDVDEVIRTLRGVQEEGRVDHAVHVQQQDGDVARTWPREQPTSN